MRERAETLTELVVGQEVGRGRPAHRLPLTAGWEIWREGVVRGAGFPAGGLLELASPAASAAADRVLEAGAEPPENLLGELRDAVERELTEAGETLDRIATRDRFLEAVLWQNRSALHVAIGLHGRGNRPPPGRRNQARRRRELLIAKYWLRYCGKNDSIGFFGPVGWFRLGAAGEPSRVAPGAGLVADRYVHFEAWAVQELAAHLERDPRLRPWLAPRLAPHLHLEGRTLRQPQRQAAGFTPAELEVLARCDGRRPAREIAADLVGLTGVRDESDVYLALDNLCRRGVVTRGLLPPVTPHAEQSLREALDRVGDAAARDRALAAVDELVAHRDRLTAAEGPNQVDRAMAGLDAAFRRLTGAESSRAPGTTYGARTLVYLECGRDLELQLGPDVWSRLTAPLGLLLDSARWLAWETARAYREALRAVHRELAEAGSPAVELSDLWFWSQAMLFGDGPRPVDPVLKAYRTHWAELLGLQGADGRPERAITHRAEDLRQRLGDRFAAPGPAWPGARYHSPDVQVAASSPEAFAAGRFEFVLGELHAAYNAVDCAAFIHRQDDLCRLLGFAEADLPEPRVVPLLPTSWPRFGGHTRDLLIRPRDLRFAFTAAPRDEGPSRTLAISELLVTEEDGELFVRSRDGSIRIELIHFLGEFLSLVVLDGFRGVWEGEHRPLGRMPRVSIDDLVVLRESWSVPASAADFAAERDETRRFLEARRWARRWGMPRFVFAKAPMETKPFFVDFDSLVSVGILAAALRSACQAGRGEERLTITEMLPTPDQAWLPDGEGGRCCSELRLLLVDTRPLVGRSPEVGR